ncbi:Maf family protein [Legionella anisa]|uniref:dTTP/UTP pyrophosphatase n=1 Tax=Legionella anisa TaxID=28082 RepID=A0AAX0WY23_9GAMM|nr:Maf family protein [Legionella anisa]AWN72796.1 septum formation protein Maf [Legionella anisa]KTC70762.1 septum formation protein [Legionella anisa]MBN5934731.1 septum formation protein Maf [Legionella anisa]MCW8423592.1 Maf family protein [Legionella anisa]MCW8447112.1 Maf family protein [Legionella anisa]
MKQHHLLKIILASASPRRVHILQEHGLPAVVMPANIEEIQQKDEEAKIYVTRLAREKAQTILARVEAGTADIILAADTTVAYQDHILEKPRDHQDAYRMLSMLSGNSHEVYTGYALIFLPEQQWQVDCVTSSITFHTLSEQQIQNYIDTGDPFDKAGGYGIQNVYDTFIKEIKGSYYNVMGLPIEEIMKKISLRYSESF